MKLLGLAVATLTLTGLSALQAQIYPTTTNTLYDINFNTMTSGSIDGNGGWVAITPATPPDNTRPGPGAINSYLSYGNILNFGGLDGYSVDATNNSTLPHNQFNYIAHPFTIDESEGKSVTGIQLNSRFAITPSSNQSASATNSQMDSFGFTLQDQNGQSLISFDLNAYNSNSLSMGYSVYGTNSGNGSYTIGTSNRTEDYGANTIPANDILLWNYSTFNTLQLTFSGLNTATVSMNVTINEIQLFSGALNANFSEIDLMTIRTASPTWLLNDATRDDSTGVYPNYGNNQMAMLNYSVNQLSIPEPQTWILFGLSGLILVVAIRRRANS